MSYQPSSRSPPPLRHPQPQPYSNRPLHLRPVPAEGPAATMSTLEELDDLDRQEKEEKRRNNGKKATVTDGDDEMKDAEEKDDILDDEILSLSTQDIQTRKRLLENDSRIMKSEQTMSEVLTQLAESVQA